MKITTKSIIALIILTLAHCFAVSQFYTGGRLAVPCVIFDSIVSWGVLALSATMARRAVVARRFRELSNNDKITLFYLSLIWTVCQTAIIWAAVVVCFPFGITRKSSSVIISLLLALVYFLLYWGGIRVAKRIGSSEETDTTGQPCQTSR